MEGAARFQGFSFGAVCEGATGRSTQHRVAAISACLQRDYTRSSMTPLETLNPKHYNTAATPSWTKLGLPSFLAAGL